MERTSPRLRGPRPPQQPNFTAVWAELPPGADKWITRRRSLGTADRAQAEVAFRDFLVGFVGSAKTAAVGYTMAELAEVYLERHCREQSRGVEATQRQALRAPLEAFGDRLPAQIKSLMWDSYVRERRKGAFGKRAVQDATIRREMSAAMALLNWSARKQLIAPGDISPMTLPKPGRPRERWLDEGQLQAVVTAADDPDQTPEYIQRAVWLMIWTGARREAVLELEWHRVNFESGIVDYRTERYTGRKRRAITPMAKALRARLEPTAQPGGRVVTGYGHVRTFAAHWEEWAESIGFPWLTPHVFRHTFITLRLRKGMDPWKIAGALNESVDTLLKTYGHHRPDHLQEVVDL